MKGLEREGEQKGDPARFVLPAGDGPQTVKVRRYGDDFTTKLKPTGSAVAPFVGILSYTEETYVCTNEGALDCKLLESSPVTEIFPYKEGRWQY